MDTLFILILLFLCIISLLWKYYQPKLEIIEINNKFEIYLWYNEWVDSVYQGRIRKYLFKI